MGWFDTKNKQQNVHVVASAWDMQKIEERNRRRRWFIFLDIILVLCIIIGIAFIYYGNNYRVGVTFLAIGLLIILYLVFKKKEKRNSKFKNRRNFRRRNFRRHRR